METAKNDTAMSRRELFGKLRDKMKSYGFYGLMEMAPKVKNNLIRPPGAGEEMAFLATCTRCGECHNSCPHGALKIASEEEGVALGTPCINPREAPCRLCMTCTKVCPSGALQEVKLHEVKMARVVINTNSCLAWRGIMCQACYTNCPFSGKAIVLQEYRKPVIQSEYCTGCGICAYVCAAEPSAVRVTKL